MKIFPHLWCAIFAFISLQQTAVVQAQSPVTTPSIRQRGIVSEGDVSRLAAVMEKARRGEEVCVAAIGGSITAGGLQTKDPKNRYIARVADWFTHTFPKARVRFVNAGIGGTNSLYGAMRVQRDVLSKKPDLVIVEYAVNDNHPVPMFWGSYEGVLRQILRESQQPAVVQLFFMQRKGENAQETQHMLGRHYNLPMVSFRDAWWPEIYSGRAKWEVMYADVVHPNDTGHILAAELLIALLDDVNRNPPAATSESVSRENLPAPMITDLFANCHYAQYTDLKPTQNSGWTQTPDGTKWESPAATDGGIEFGFAGKLLFVGYDLDEEAERFATFSIDGGSAQPLKKSPNRLPLAEDLAPGQHRVRIEFAGSKVPQGSTAKVRIWAVGAAGAAE
jgi:lysophospholipase L1-like esterase